MQRTPTFQPRLAAQTRSSGPHHERVADPRCTAVASCSYRRLRSVISHHRLSASFAVLCMLCHACDVSRVWRAPRKKRIRYYGQMVTMPEFGFDGVSSSLAKFMSIFFPQLFFQPFFLYYVRNPDTTVNTESTPAAQGACYNQLATTLYTPAACSRAGGNATRVR